MGTREFNAGRISVMDFNISYRVGGGGEEEMELLLAHCCGNQDVGLWLYGPVGPMKTTHTYTCTCGTFVKLGLF